MSRKVLGRGLRALIDEGDKQSTTTSGVHTVSVTEISANPDQPRSVFDEKKLAWLAESIADKGIMQPLVVKRSAEGYQLIAGERRLRAAKLAGLDSVPVVVREVTSPEEMLQLSLIENVQRENLNPMEEARGYAQLCEDFGMGQEAVANAVGKDRSTVANALRLLKLPSEAQQALEGGRISAGHARAILSIKGEQAQRDMLQRLLNESLNVRETEALAKGGRRARTQSAQASDPEVMAVEEALQRCFGTRVSISPRGRGGRVVVHYQSPEDLDRLLDLWNLGST